jgi:methylmalonyl-CoA/ethylmalonyl-CoA epimerase
MTRYQLDHVAVAVPRLADVVGLVVGELGATPAEGGPGIGFIGAQWSFANEARLEVLEPAGEPDGFLHRFLAQHGRGIHHVTFVVPDLAEAAQRARDDGRTVVGYNDAFPSWKEAFLHPKSAHGIVIQFAEAHPELGDGAWNASFPFPESPPPARPAAALRALRLNVHDANRALSLWSDLLGGAPIETEGVFSLRWPDCPLRIRLEQNRARPEGALALEIECARPLSVPGGIHPVLGVKLDQLPLRASE